MVVRSRQKASFQRSGSNWGPRGCLGLPPRVRLARAVALGGLGFLQTTTRYPSDHLQRYHHHHHSLDEHRS